MAGRKGLTQEHAARSVQHSGKDDVLRSGIQNALKGAKPGKPLQAFRSYKNLDVAGAGCGCGCGTVKKKK